MGKLNSKQYVIYHLHSDISNGVTNIDSITKYQEYIDMAAECKMSALAFSEHGSVFDWYGKKCAIEKAGMKYIHAEEFYITQTIKDDVKIRDNWHCILIAKNWEGVKELNRLATKSFNRADGHYYYVPRIELDDLYNTSDNIIITSACLGGILAHANIDIQKDFINFMSANKHRCFLEVQHHNVVDQITYNQRLYAISQKTGIRLIAGTDTHVLNEKHAKGRIVLQRAKKIFFDNENGWDLTFKTYDELCEAYRKQNSLPEEVYLQAIENTNVMADMVEEFVMDKKTKYPKIYDNPQKTFQNKIINAYNTHPYVKKNHSRDEVIKQVKEEYDAYCKTGAIDFMLLQTYIREWEQNNEISSGYGRGSVSGSMIAYLLDITKMDSLRFGLNFFRFINPDRVSNADIDTDYCSKDREKVKYFLLHDKMNLKNIQTSEIITFNTIATKGAIKDVCRAMNLSIELAQDISDAVIDDEFPAQYLDKYAEIAEYVDLVKGTIVSIGSHPSGVLVSDRNIEEDVGLCTLSTSDYPVSMLDMHGLDDLMYVKLDILGLDNIGVINECCKLAGIERLTPDNVDLADEKVWESIRQDTTMIFQWESESAAQYLKKFMSEDTIKIAKSINKDFSYIKWFSFGNGLIRPGCASFRYDVANGDVVRTGFKELDDFLAITFGRVTMQEDIMRFLTMFCGYSNAESDTVRRGIAKKKGTEQFIDEIHDRFLEYSHTHYNVDINKLEEIFPPIKQGILDASSYAFSWNHSDAYSCIGYISGYLRYYYPLEFLTAAFNIFTDKTEKIAAITQYANEHNITIKAPKFRYSSSGYQLDKSSNAIYKGLKSIKFMNEKVAEDLYALRNNTYNSFFDFLRDYTGDTRQLEILIKLDFFEEFGKSQKLLNMFRLYDTYAGNKVVKKDKLPDHLIPFFAQYCDKETPKQFRFDNGVPNVLLSLISESIPNKSIPLGSILSAEQEYLGYITYVNPAVDPQLWIVTSIKVFNGVHNKPYVTLYQIQTGKTLMAKIQRINLFDENPFRLYSILNLREGSFTEQYKRKQNAEGKWIETDELKLILDSYEVVVM